MNIKKLLISETEKLNILKQYGLIVEQAVPTNSLTVDKKITFPGGYYSEKYLGKDLPVEIAKIQEFLKSKTGKGFLVDVIIESGESRIPNTDNENNGDRVKPGFLSQKRNETIQNYINKQLQSFVDDKLLVKLPKFTITPPKIGQTLWIGQPFCPKNLLPKGDDQGYECSKSTFNPGKDAGGKQIVNWASGKQTTYKKILDAYTTEQYIRIKITVKEITDMKACLDNMTIEVNYTDLSKRHVCNSAIYEIYIKGNLNTANNGFLLTRSDGNKFASLNNNSRDANKVSPELIKYDNEPKKVGGVRYNKFTVTPEMASGLVSDGSTSFIISAKCINPYNNNMWKGGCHEGVGNIVIVNGKGEKTEYTSETPNAKNEVKTLVPIDACGKSATQAKTT
jgi:hypothetical protein